MPSPTDADSESINNLPEDHASWPSPRLLPKLLNAPLHSHLALSSVSSPSRFPNKPCKHVFVKLRLLPKTGGGNYVLMLSLALDVPWIACVTMYLPKLHGGCTRRRLRHGKAKISVNSQANVAKSISETPSYRVQIECKYGKSTSFCTIY